MISRNSSEAMYIQIANILRAEIARSVYPPGGTIGTHKVLASRFGVSLITVRKAVDILLNEGLLIAGKGKGTFVASAPMQDGFNRLTGMSTVISMNNATADVSVKSMQYIGTPTHLEEDVRFGLGEHCLYIERTHEVRGKAIGFADIYIPDSYADCFTAVDVASSTIYSLFEKKLGVTLGKGVQSIRADEADSRVAEILQIPPKAPVLVIKRKSYDNAGNLIEFMIIHYDHTQYSFQVELDLFTE